MKKQLSLALTALLVVCLLASAAWAETPTAFVKGVLNRVIAIQTNPAQSGPEHRAARAQTIRRVIQKSFDFPLMARNSLGSVYDRLPAGKRRDFTATFGYLFQDSYTRMVLDFLKRETIHYGKQTMEGANARVDTKLIRTNETIPVDYMMRPQGNSWLLYDVIVDGVSILDNYKRQFALVIRTNSFDFLLKKMKTQMRALN